MLLVSLMYGGEQHPEIVHHYQVETGWVSWAASFSSEAMAGEDTGEKSCCLWLEMHRTSGDRPPSGVCH